MIIELMNQQYELLPEKCLMHIESETLFISDLHLGKTNHFRRAGIAVPGAIIMEEMTAIQSLFSKYKPKTVVFLGDLFHSSSNHSVELFNQILDNEVGIKFLLVKGNHDIMRQEIYESMGIEVVKKYLFHTILFTHEPVVDCPYFNIYGHIHPAIVMGAKGKQSLRLPCFYFNEKEGILPAFGVFTGLFNLTVSSDDRVFVIANDKVIKIQ
jgi:uncharacterized protein